MLILMARKIDIKRNILYLQRLNFTKASREAVQY